MRLTFLLGALAIAGVATTAPAQATPITKWCAPSRPQEPLILDANRMATSADSASMDTRSVPGAARVAPTAVVVIRDEATCERAAIAYRDRMRQFVAENWPDAPVLVVRVGEFYFVDDLRSREGDEAYWEVIVFDANWKKKMSYGVGS